MSIQAYIQDLRKKPVETFTCRELRHFLIKANKKSYQVMEKIDTGFYFTDGEKIIEVEPPELSYMINHIDEPLPFSYEDDGAETVATFEYEQVSRYIRYQQQLMMKREQEARKAKKVVYEQKKKWKTFLKYQPHFASELRSRCLFIPDDVPMTNKEVITDCLKQLITLLATNRAEVFLTSFYNPVGDYIPTWTDEMLVHLFEYLFKVNCNDSKYKITKKIRNAYETTLKEEMK